MGDIIEFPNRKEQLENDPERMIAGVSTFDQLEQVLDTLKRIQGSQEVYSAEDLIDKINRVRSGSLTTNYLTRTYGLRGKVEQLLQAEPMETQQQEQVDEVPLTSQESNQNRTIEGIHYKILVDGDVHELVKTVISTYLRDSNAVDRGQLTLSDVEDLLRAAPTSAVFLGKFVGPVMSSALEECNALPEGRDKKIAEAQIEYMKDHFFSSGAAKRASDVLYGTNYAA